MHWKLNMLLSVIRDSKMNNIGFRGSWIAAEWKQYWLQCIGWKSLPPHIHSHLWVQQHPSTSSNQMECWCLFNQSSITCVQEGGVRRNLVLHQFVPCPQHIFAFWSQCHPQGGVRFIPLRAWRSCSWLPLLHHLGMRTRLKLWFLGSSSCSSAGRQLQNKPQGL